MENVLAIMRLILFKLIRMDKWGGSHTEIRNLTKGLPSRYLTTHRGKKLVQEAIKELNNRGFLIAKPSTGEIHVSLNPRMAKDINEFLQQFNE
jgi:hypothetical protein